MLSAADFKKWKYRATRILRRFRPKIARQTPLIAGAFIIMLLEIGLRVLQPWPLKFIFDAVIAPSSKRQLMPPLLEALSPAALLAGACIASVLLTGSRAAASYFSTVSLALAGNRVLTEVRRELYHHLLRLSLAYHDRSKSGDLITRVTGDVGRLQEVAVTAVLPLFVHSLTLACMLGMMFWMNWRLALVALTAAINATQAALPPETALNQAGSGTSSCFSKCFTQPSATPSAAAQGG